VVLVLTLHYHPFSSFGQKAAIGLYELGVPFEKVIVDLMTPESREAFRKISPFMKIPALYDDEKRRSYFESTILLEAAGGRLLPDLEARLMDRIFDVYIQQPMQKVVTDRNRPKESRDPFGVAEARRQLTTAYEFLNERLADRDWCAGETFTAGDCSAAPGLYYSAMVHPFDAYPVLAAYYTRLRGHPSVARVFDEAKPFAHYFPRE
jgi:glutathione S-transferase